MSIAWWLFVSIAVLELACLYTPVWKLRKVLLIPVVTLASFAASSVLVSHWNAFSGVLAFFTIYRVFNDVRVLEGRTTEQHLRRAARRTAAWLVVLQIITALSWLGWGWLSAVARHALLGALPAVLAVVAVLLLLSAWRSMRKTAPPASLPALSSQQLPTLSICIPARNETDDLETCLESIIASDYPKLEVLVLDDCSQNKRTPEIIRAFAHDGVRFLPGRPPAADWLPKNWAYQQLAAAANGDILLFCGVDVRFGSHSVRRLVETMAYKHKNMLSVIPERAHADRWPVIQAMRYWWELVPPRRLFYRPPVLSTCWLITHEALGHHGGFAAARRSIVPEAVFARQLLSSDAYSFVRSGAALGVQTVKKLSEQRATAVRVRYPQLHRRPELIALLTLAEAILLLLPFGLLIGTIINQHEASVAFCGALVAVIALVLTHVAVVGATMPSAWPAAIINFPFVSLTDMFLLQLSMYKYEFSTVSWKGRNVCLPAMHVAPIVSLRAAAGLAQKS